MLEGSSTANSSSKLQCIFYIAILFLVFAKNELKNELSFFRNLDLSADVFEYAKSKDFEVKAYKFEAQAEELRAPRLVRVGIIQNKMVLPTTAPVADQRRAIHKRIEEILVAAGQGNVNIVCFQEAWSKRFLCHFFCGTSKDYVSIK